MSAHIKLNQVFDRRDHAQLNDLITRVAERTFTIAKGELNFNLAIPAALMLVRDYMQELMDQHIQQFELEKTIDQIGDLVAVNMPKRTIN